MLFDCSCSLCVAQSEHLSGAQRFDAYADYVEGTPPQMRTHANTEAYGHMAEFYMQEEGEVDYHKTKGVTGCSPLRLLPYFDIIAHTTLDMMHIVSGVIGRTLIGMLTGARLKNSIRNDQKSQSNEERKRKAEEDKEKAALDRTAKRICSLQDQIPRMRKNNPKRWEKQHLVDTLLILPQHRDLESDSEEELEVSSQTQEGEGGNNQKFGLRSILVSQSLSAGCSLCLCLSE